MSSPSLSCDAASTSAAEASEPMQSISLGKALQLLWRRFPHAKDVTDVGLFHQAYLTYYAVTDREIELPAEETEETTADSEAPKPLPRRISVGDPAHRQAATAELKRFESTGSIPPWLHDFLRGKTVGTH